MIVKNDLEQWIGCTACGERIEIRRSTLRDPEKVMIMVEQMRDDHAPCTQFVGKPDRKGEKLNNKGRDGLR